MSSKGSKHADTTSGKKRARTETSKSSSTTLPDETDYEMDSDEDIEFPPTQVESIPPKKFFLKPATPNRPNPKETNLTGLPSLLPKPSPNGETQLCVSVPTRPIKEKNELLSAMVSQITQDYLKQTGSANVQLAGLKIGGVAHMVSGIVLELWNLHLTDAILGKGKVMGPADTKQWEILFMCLHDVSNVDSNWMTMDFNFGPCKYERLAFAINILGLVRSTPLKDLEQVVKRVDLPFFCRLFAFNLLIASEKNAKRISDSAPIVQGKDVSSPLVVIEEMKKFVEENEEGECCRTCSREDWFYKAHRYYSLVTKIILQSEPVQTMNELMDSFRDCARERGIAFSCDVGLNRKQMFYVHEEYLRFWGLERSGIRKLEFGRDADESLLEILFMFIYRDKRIKSTGYISHIKEITQYCAEIGFPNPSAIVKFDVMNLEQLLKSDREKNLSFAKQYCLKNLSEWFENDDILRTLSFDSMKDFVDDDHLAKPEKTIFDLCIRWAKLTSPNESTDAFQRISTYLRIGRLSLNEFGQLRYNEHKKYIEKLDANNIVLYLQDKEFDPEFDSTKYIYNDRERNQLN